MKAKKLTAIVAFALVAAVAVGCGKKKEETPATSTGATDGQIVVTLTDFKIEPATLTLKKDTEQTIVVKNASPNTPHDFVVPGLNIRTPHIDPRGEYTLTVKPTESGTFEAICEVPGHKELGMTSSVQVQ